MVKFAISRCGSCFGGARCSDGDVAGYFSGQCIPEKCQWFKPVWTEKNGVKYINTTPHIINFRDPETGEEFEVPPCGVLVNARPLEVKAGERGGVDLVRTEFVPDEASLAELDAIEALVPGAVIIGSIIAAKAYPGRVVAMTPCPGFERVAPAEKRMNPRKFTTFEG